MASTSFYFSSMNSGKSLLLIKMKYDYETVGKKVVCLTPSLNNRDGDGVIKSRALNRKITALKVKQNDCIKTIVDKEMSQKQVDLILVDEAQFFTEKQVEELTHYSDLHNIHVMCFGLRTDSNGDLFDGSAKLLAIADKLIEVKNTCHCGKKATMTLRIDSDRNVLKNQPQVSIGSEEKYISVCRKHWFDNNPGDDAKM